MYPDDPVCHLSDLCGADDDEFRIAPGSANRAAMMARFAAESGLDFNEVRCLRFYARIFTRQEVWDAEGRDRAADQANMDAKYGYYFERYVWTMPNGETVTRQVRPLGIGNGRNIKVEVLPEGWYSDLDSTTPIVGFEATDFPERVPDDWEPHDGYIGWETCGKNDEGAIPMWECSTW